MDESKTKILAVIPTILPTARLVDVCQNLVSGSPRAKCDVQVIYNTETSYKHVEPKIWSQAMEDKLNDLADVFYRCNKAGLYRQMGEAIPEGVQARPDYEASFRQWEADGYPPLK